MPSPFAGLGKRIAARRRAAGLTQERLAELAGIHPRALQKVEAGANLPMLSTLCRIQAALGCDWRELFSEERSGKRARDARAGPS